MNAVTVPKSSRANMLEGIALLAAFQGFPLLTVSALALKLTGSDLVNQPGGAAIFVVLSSITYAAMIGFFAPKYPKFFKALYQPLFFDAGLSRAEKIQRWRTQPERSSQLVLLVMMLSVMAIAVISVR